MALLWMELNSNCVVLTYTHGIFLSSFFMNAITFSDLYLYCQGRKNEHSKMDAFLHRSLLVHYHDVCIPKSNIWYIRIPAL